LDSEAPVEKDDVGVCWEKARATKLKMRTANTIAFIL
jgi:hypothetical protein